MKKYSWHDINLFQWMQLTALFTESNNTELDLIVKAAAIVLNRTEHEIDSIPYSKLKDIGDAISFIHTDVPADPARYIYTNGKRYRCVYDIAKLPAARYIESKAFSQDPANNLHKLAASMVIPQRRVMKCGWYVDARYDASMHSIYAEDMLSAPITQIFGSCLFFYAVFKQSNLNIVKWITEETTEKTTMIRAQIGMEAMRLLDAMDGIIAQRWSQSLRTSRYRLRMN